MSREGHGPPIFSNRRIFGNFNALSEKFWTSAVRKDKGFELYRKIIELGPPLLYRCHDVSVYARKNLRERGESGLLMHFKDALSLSIQLMEH